MKINKQTLSIMEMIAATAKYENDKTEEKKRPSANKHKKLKYYKLIFYKIEPFPIGNL